MPDTLKGNRTTYRDLQHAASNTPLVELARVSIPNNNRILAKIEYAGATGSLFDRLYPDLLHLAQRRGLIAPGVTPLIEGSSGNAGAAFAYAAKALGYADITVVIHADAPNARIEHLKSLGAKVVLSPAGAYCSGFVRVLEERLRADRQKKTGQLGSNPERLYCVTKIERMGQECYSPLVDEAIKQGGSTRIDVFVGVVGSGTSISSIGRQVKRYNAKAKVVAVDPVECPTTLRFLRGAASPLSPSHAHQLWGASSFGLPQNKLNIDLSVIDEVRLVRKDEWQEGCAILADREGLHVGRTSGAALMKALEIAHLVHNVTFLIVLYDAAWKYDESYHHWK